jgi:thiosulfate/3-mercaptopyruvate sulfurtransferase
LQKKRYLAIAVVLIAVALALVVKNKPKDPGVNGEKSLKVDVSEFAEHIFITPSQLHEKLGSRELVILDASHPKGYAKGHIPGAISIGFKGLSDCNGKPGDKEWGTVLPKEKLTQKLESLGVDNTKLVVAYSDIFKGPGAGGRAVWQIKMAGFENVRLLYGGLGLWKKSGYAISKSVPVLVPAKGLTLKDYDESFRADQPYIHDHLDTLKIVDVRSLKEYTGADTSRGEARGGHIQGSQWLEWTTLLNEDASVKSVQEIKELMAGVGILPTDDFVLY